jgi:Helicase associated domain
LTATPRHYDIRHRDEEGDFRIASMDNEAIYGPRAYTLTFGSAARQGIICNYKVVISVVDGQEVNEFALKHGITLVEGDLIGARWVANQIAVERAVEKTGAKRAISFHSRVSSAVFSSDGTRGIDPRRLLEKIEVIGPPIELSALRSNICAEVVDRVGVSWDEMFGRLLLFRGTHGHCRVPRGYKDKKLGKWVQHQRSFATNGILSTVRKQRLDDIGFDWDPFETDWAEGLRYLTIYKEREGHCRVPFKHMENGFRLGSWVDKQRQSKNQETLSEARRQQLDQLGFVWDPLETDWAEGLRYLTIYKEREGHCRVPFSHMEDGFRLGQWVRVQRRNADSLSAPRRQQLDELGFVWDPLQTNWGEASAI